MNLFIPKKVKSDDEPVNALRKLKRSSMRLGINQVSSNEADGFVSAETLGFDGHFKVCLKT